jgi:thioredoxin-related protein
MTKRSLSRRSLLALMAGAGLALAALPSHLGLAEPTEPMIGADGLYTQPWFVQSFFELRDDLAEANAAGKQFAVLWEQRGCPYCRELHQVNLADPEIGAYARENFAILQLDIWGDRKVTDFDGEEMTERELARRWGVSFTPSLIFFPKNPAEVEGKVGGKAEIARMPGYFKPFHFQTMLIYVREKHYKKVGFQEFLKARTEQLQKEGEEVKFW